MHIAFAASEGVPFSKTGGLADVVEHCRAPVSALGHQVSSICRGIANQISGRSYGGFAASRCRSMTSIVSPPSHGRHSIRRALLFRGLSAYFDRDALYGTPGVTILQRRRFALFSRAVRKPRRS